VGQQQMQVERLEQLVGRFRYASIIAVVASALGSLLMFVIGGVKVFLAYSSYLGAALAEGGGMKDSANVAIDYMVQAIDAFLIAVVLMIFGGGIFNLFIREISSPEPGAKHIVEIRKISQLKRVLAELVIVILMVKFLEEALHNLGSYRWEMLILPAAVLMMAIAVRVLRLKEL
jgi:uncharacterized membrane protein YqhA